MPLLDLGLIPKIFRSKHDQHEKRKSIIDVTFDLVLRRGLIHLLPFSISITLIGINLQHLYIGPNLNFLSLTTTNSLAAFQIAAKIQELLAVASMTTVLFEVIRHQLLYGEGLPLGLLSSGFTFSKFDFFSKATWFWFRSKSAIWQKSFILFCLTLTAVLASVIGPASAVLILPRQVDEVVFTPQFWLNGTSDDLFPITLSDTHIGHPLTPNASDPNPCTISNSWTNEHCVSRTYQKLQALLDSTPDTAHWDWTVIFRENNVARVLALHENVETWTRSPHVATAYVQNIFWWDRTWFDRFGQSPNGRVSVVGSQTANVRTACLQQKVTVNTTQIDFPSLELYHTYSYDTNTSVTVKPDIWSQDNVSFVGPDLVRTVWVDGAQSIEAVTAGLVVLAPLASPNDTTRPALVCSIDARWGDSNHEQSDGPINIAITADVKHPRHDDSHGSGFLPANNSHWKHIKASLTWLEAFTPALPYPPPASSPNLQRSASTIADLLMRSGHDQLPSLDRFQHGYQDAPYQFWESVIATYFADGVARVGYSRQLNSPLFFVEGSDREGGKCVKFINTANHNVSTCPENKPKSENFTTFSLEGRLKDIFAYRASAKTDFASISILCVYLCIALVRFLYSLIQRRSSRAWEKLEDLLALAHSSHPDPSILSNTCAGMSEARTKAQLVRIVVVGDGTSGAEGSDDDDDDDESRVGFARVKAFAGEAEAVQMRFVDGMHDDGTAYRRVEPRTRYGKMD